MPKSHKQLREDVNSINVLSKQINTLTKEELILKWGEETDTLNLLAILHNLIPTYYGYTLHSQQLLSILAMLDDNLVEVKTGEGKTIVTLVTAILLTKRKSIVYIVTTNTYLSTRDYSDAQALLTDLSITSSFNAIQSLESPVDKETIHNAQIVFTDCSELTFDYLRDVLTDTTNVKFECAILDEIDMVIVDNALTLCDLVEGTAPYDHSYTFYYNLFFSIADELTYTTVPIDEDKAYEYWDVDFVQFKTHKTVTLTNKGCETLRTLLGIDVLADGNLYYLLHTVLNATVNYILNKDYAIVEGRCSVINQATGRAQKNTQFPIDIQNAIEIKHGLDITLGADRHETISYQVFYSKFKTLLGLSGTLKDIEEELFTLFNKEIIEVEPNKEIRRVDVPTFYFKTTDAKVKALLNLVDKDGDAPKLIVTSDDNTAMEITDLLLECYPERHIKALTNLNLEAEDRILVEAGKRGNITVSTSICGRGTDIKVSEHVKEGLTVVLFEHFENSRIDLQVRGRSGRQGQRGKSYTLSSLDDSIWNMLSLKEKGKLCDIKDTTFNSEKHQALLDAKRRRIQQNLYDSQKSTRYTLYLTSLATHKYSKELKSIQDLPLEDLLTHRYSTLSEYVVKLDDYYDLEDFIVSNECATVSDILPTMTEDDLPDFKCLLNDFQIPQDIQTSEDKIVYSNTYLRDAMYYELFYLLLNTVKEGK